MNMTPGILCSSGVAKRRTLAFKPPLKSLEAKKKCESTLTFFINRCKIRVNVSYGPLLRLIFLYCIQNNEKFRTFLLIFSTCLRSSTILQEVSSDFSRFCNTTFPGFARKILRISLESVFRVPTLGFFSLEFSPKLASIFQRKQVPVLLGCFLRRFL